MTHRLEATSTSPIPFLEPQAPDGRTPAGLQSRRVLFWRRIVMLSLCAVTLLAVIYGVAQVFAADGLGVLDCAILFAVALSAPWTILGFWNALLGLHLAFRDRAALLAVEPVVSGPIDSRVAIAIAIRNEDAARVMQRAVAIRHSLDATGSGARFDLHILSDSDDAGIAREEAGLFAANVAALHGAGRAFYRRRTDNSGYKAGNIWQFLEEHGEAYELFVPLDADSLMSGETILRLVRTAEANPKVGILQSLAVGAPSDSAFGRIFQFGMRHGMRGFTLGSAWWQGDCGPFWGHNAVIRTAAFRAHCALPKLGGQPPLGGDILSHDQIEAVLMRRAGFEVRVLPVETESFEENPVTVLDFIKREQRWCNGNMQYFRLLGLPGLMPVSRFQLVQAIMMYLSAPAWMLLTALGALKALLDPMTEFDRPLAIWLFAIMIGMSLAPKVAGVLHVAFERGGVRRYGGVGRFTLGLLIETVFSVLMAPVVAFHLSMFLIGLMFGRRSGWQGQIRDAYGLDWSTALRAFWPQMLFGATVLAAVRFGAPGAIPWVMPVLAGLLSAPIVAVATASPRLGAWLAARRLCGIPEDFTKPAILDLVESGAAPRQHAA